ncbi:Serine 3-dehydrogenase [Mycena venus]|uniref:Serine 3-dehydrogenase n=1 Tax=Mycena venus TaxID=2733690 RepID=A0A8H7CEV6_9AGAR|nr:Serine 3-dehydrogenase [Mycena venus]
MSSQLVWLITGTSAGLGRDLALAALKRGDHVIATARSVAKLNDLKEKGADVLELDVTAPLDKLHEIAKTATAIHGRIDVVVNNAGYILVGAIEESTPEETLEQFNTNVFGALNVTRAFLPYMRAKKSGTVVFMGSVGGWIGGPNVGLYCATKFTLRGISESLHLEIAPLGLRSTCIDFGYFRTTFLDPAHRAPYVPRIEDYNEMSKRANDALLSYDGKQPGDPAKGVEVVLDIVRGEGLAAGKAFPTSVALGSDCYKTIKEEAESVLGRLEEWRAVSESTDF